MKYYPGTRTSMQGQFWKNFRPRGAGAQPGRGASRTPPFRLQSGRRPGTSRHETGPSTTFGRHRPTMRFWAKLKPQVDGLRFSLYTRYGRGVGLKRSRWAGFVAAAWRAAAPRRHEAGKRLSSDRFPANYTGRWPVAPFPSSFGFLFCTCSVIPNVSKDFARSNQAAQHR